MPSRSILGRAAPFVLAVLLLAGCGSDAPPQVTFTAGGATVVAAPTQYCDDDFVTCRNDATAPVDLAVPPGTPLVIDVPESIAETPWQVVFTYRDSAGEPVDQRSPVLVDRSSYTLELPTPQDRLLTAQVQQYGPPPEINPETGEAEFPIGASWVLLTSA